MSTTETTQAAANGSLGISMFSAIAVPITWPMSVQIMHFDNEGQQLPEPWKEKGTEVAKHDPGGQPSTCVRIQATSR